MRTSSTWIIANATLMPSTPDHGYLMAASIRTWHLTLIISVGYDDSFKLMA